MKCMIKSIEELPLFLAADDVSRALGLSLSGAYSLMHRKDFPTITIGRRYIVSREKLVEWVGNQL